MTGYFRLFLLYNSAVKKGIDRGLFDTVIDCADHKAKQKRHKHCNYREHRAEPRELCNHRR